MILIATYFQKSVRIHFVLQSKASRSIRNSNRQPSAGRYRDLVTKKRNIGEISSPSQMPDIGFGSPSSISTSNSLSTLSTQYVSKRLFDMSGNNFNSDLKDDKYSRATIMKQSAKDPQILIGCRVFINGRGRGTVTGIRRKKFHSTLFEIVFDSCPAQVTYLKLRREGKKTGEEFQILSRSHI